MVWFAFDYSGNNFGACTDSGVVLVAGLYLQQGLYGSLV